MDVVTREDEELLVDLLNTTPVVAGDRTDELAGPEAAAWATSRGGAGTPDEITELRQLRDAMQAVVDDASGVQQPDLLVQRLERVTVHPRWRDGALGWEIAVGPEGMIAARVLLAWASISERSPERLRPCANPECCRFLLDRSNANTARWCSMALCGNRAKVRRHYERSRSGVREKSGRASS